jgi:hypothetical protein
MHGGRRAQSLNPASAMCGGSPQEFILSGGFAALLRRDSKTVGGLWSAVGLAVVGGCMEAAPCTVVAGPKVSTPHRPTQWQPTTVLSYLRPLQPCYEEIQRP